MQYSSILNYHTTSVIVDSGVFSVLISQTPVVISNRISDTIVLSGSVYPGQVYSQISYTCSLSDNLTDTTAESIFVVESSSLSGSFSICNIVYKGIIDFSGSSIVLTPGSPYFLTTDSGQNGPINVRNLTINEPTISKPILISISETKAVVVNMRGIQNGFQPYINLPNNVPDLPCGNVLVDPTNPLFQPGLPY